MTGGSVDGSGPSLVATELLSWPLWGADGGTDAMPVLVPVLAAWGCAAGGCEFLGVVRPPRSWGVYSVVSEGPAASMHICVRSWFEWRSRQGGDLWVERCMNSKSDWLVDGVEGLVCKTTVVGCGER